jgi:hypothetical protein
MFETGEVASAKRDLAALLRRVVFIGEATLRLRLDRSLLLPSPASFGCMAIGRGISNMRRLGIVALCVALGGCATAPSASEPYVACYTPDELRELAPAEKALLAKGFAKNLKDPDSAKFEWVKVPKAWSNNGGGFDYCATLNAKNSYGGYIGYQPFIGFVMTSGTKITGGYITAVSGSDATERQIVNDMCAKKGLDPSPRQ